MISSYLYAIFKLSEIYLFVHQNILQQAVKLIFFSL